MQWDRRRDGGGTTACPRQRVKEKICICREPEIQSWWEIPRTRRGSNEGVSHHCETRPESWGHGQVLGVESLELTVSTRLTQHVMDTPFLHFKIYFLAFSFWPELLPSGFTSGAPTSVFWTLWPERPVVPGSGGHPSTWVSLCLLELTPRRLQENSPENPSLVFGWCDKCIHTLSILVRELETSAPIVSSVYPWDSSCHPLLGVRACLATTEHLQWLRFISAPRASHWDPHIISMTEQPLMGCFTLCMVLKLVLFWFPFYRKGNWGIKTEPVKCHRSSVKRRHGQDWKVCPRGMG